MNDLNLGSKLFCLIDGNKGAYIPKVFAQRWGSACVAGITQEEIDILLSGPDNDQYWDTWDDCINEIQFLFDGQLCGLEEDNDLFAVPFI